MDTTWHLPTSRLIIVLVALLAVLACANLLLGQQSHNPLFMAGNTRPEVAETARNPMPTTPPAKVDSETSTPSTTTVGPSVKTPPTVVSTVQVTSDPEDLSAGIDLAHHITQADVLSSAGTFGDFSRYLQTLPSVVWNNDITNELMVRGGHPIENLFVVDGFEVPNINHLAFAGTTGGFTSMIDTSVVDSVDMKDDGYSSRYSSRLSALVDVHTLGEQKGMHAHAEAGISGIGGFFSNSYPQNASILLAGHRSALDWFTDDIGLNGVPIYDNGLLRGDWKNTSGDHASVTAIAGGDSITIKPCAWDAFETLINDTNYRGSRFIQGAQWQHPHSARALSTFRASYSLQSRNVEQQQEGAGIAIDFEPEGARWCEPLSFTEVYREAGTESLGGGKYEFDITRRGLNFVSGTSVELAGNNYKVTQPKGQQSPFNLDPTWTDSVSFSHNTNTGRTGTFVEASYRTENRWTLLGGARYETSALTGSHAINPRASLSFRINSHQTFNFSANRASQEPPAIDILSYPQNRGLSPMVVKQISAAMDVWRSGPITAQLQAFHKRYSNEPVSTEYPSLMLANMVDTLGQQIVWLPLQTRGTGKADGISALIRANWNPWIQVITSSSYGHVRYAATDGILRPGNFDLRFIGNGLLASHLSKRFTFCARDTYASGRPYTPFDLVHSVQQTRGIYDLNRINALRGPAYNRLDLELAYSTLIRRRQLTVHAGIENAFDRKNFLGFYWLPRVPQSSHALTQEHQLVRMPIIRATYDF